MDLQPGPNSGVTPTRADRRRERTRTQLVEATRELVSEKGVAALRIGEITERADVALGSFYNHFASKDEAVEAVVTETLAALAQASVSDPPESVDHAVVVGGTIRRFIRLAYEDERFARLLVHLDHADALFASAVQPFARTAVERGVASGRFDLVDQDVAVISITGGALALMRAIVDDQHGPGADRAYAEQVLRVLGIPPAEARRISLEPDEGDS